VEAEVMGIVGVTAMEFVEPRILVCVGKTFELKETVV
jgi:hypothetical protein